MSDPANGHPAPKVLIADDEAMLRIVAAETLQDAGFDVSEAGDGTSALEILRSDPTIELLVSDIKMPGLNGIELAEAGLKLRPELKILLMTGYATENLPDSLRERGLEILRKPFDFDQLSALALSLVDKRA
ncbi:MAG TPA: response regulator [Rhizomicrobium sp.]|nr:response regulator [Rhizomicrobium sp.]